MKKVQIFVEGIADAKLIQDIVKHWYNVDLIIGKQGNEVVNPDILLAGGKDSIFNFSQTFLTNKKLGIDNIVIFDADKYEEESLKFINYKKTLPINNFLLPDNRSNGDLETLLEQIITDDNRFMFECWNNFINCLESSQIEKLFLPSSKKKIYTYLELLLGEESAVQELKKERGRDYQNTNHWNLDSSALQNLKQFLDPYFLNNND
jgi:hypothetical protein